VFWLWRYFDDIHGFLATAPADAQDFMAGDGPICLTYYQWGGSRSNRLRLFVNGAMPGDGHPVSPLPAVSIPIMRTLRCAGTGFQCGPAAAY